MTWGDVVGCVLGSGNQVSQNPPLTGLSTLVTVYST